MRTNGVETTTTNVSVKNVVGHVRGLQKGHARTNIQALVNLLETVNHRLDENVHFAKMSIERLATDALMYSTRSVIVVTRTTSMIRRTREVERI